MAVIDLNANDLRYLEAQNVSCPTGTLADLDVRTLDEEKLGAIEGVLIDPVRRRVRYYVVESRGWLKARRYLVSADDAPAVIEPDDKVLRVATPADDVERQEFDPSSTPHFSDEDVVTAMFSSHAA